MFLYILFLKYKTYSSIFGFPQKTCTPFYFHYEKKWIHRFIGEIDVLGYISSIARGRDCACVCNEYWEKSIDSYERLTFEDASWALLGEEIVHVFAMSIEKNPLIHMRDWHLRMHLKHC
jgi:hypothetical protein